jgi:serine/threonine-protein kinase
MATVFLARLGGAGGFQRLFAIKRLHPHLAHEREFVEMFLDEARLAARIHHPNVVPILEVGNSELGYYLVMEYVEGETFARMLARCSSTGVPMPTRVALKIMLDTLSGLHAAHELRDDFDQPLNIVHRDVSPQNVMVGVDGTARITDFGVARAATRLTTTRAGQLKGKLGYMAPEQARGEDIDRRADVFSVGVMLWEALGGTRLFKGKGDGHDAQTLNRLLYEPIPSLAQVRPDAAPAFVQVCDRALAREPADRFATCAALSEAIEGAAEHAGGLATAREVAAFVETLFGADIAAQRDAVRSWTAHSAVGLVARADIPTLPDAPLLLTTPASASNAAAGAAASPETHPERAGARRSLGAAALVLAAALLAAALAVWAWVVTHGRGQGRAAAAPSAQALAAPGDSTAPEGGVAVPERSAAPAGDVGEQGMDGAAEPGPNAMGTGARPVGVSGPSRDAGQPAKGPAKGTDDLETNPYR